MVVVFWSLVCPLRGGEARSTPDLNRLDARNLTPAQWRKIEAEVAAGRGQAVVSLLEKVILGWYNDWNPAVDALAKVDPARTLTLLTAEMGDKNDYRRTQCIAALGRLGPAAAPAVGALTEAVSQPLTGSNAVEALGKIGPAAAESAPAIARWLENPELRVDEQVRGCLALGQITGEADAQVDPLARLLDVPGEKALNYRADTLKAIGALAPGSRRALPAVAAVLNEPKISHTERAWAAWCLGQFGAEARGAAPDLKRAMNEDPYDNVRAGAILALQKVGAADFDVPQALEQSRDRDYQEQLRKYPEADAAARPYTRDLPPVTRVEIYALGGASAKSPRRLKSRQGGFPIRPYKLCQEITAHRTLTGAEAEEVAAAWRKLRVAMGYQMMCHFPVVGLRFYGGQKGQLLLETSVCFGCQNFYVKDGWFGFDAKHATGQEFAALTRRLLPPQE